MQALQKFRNFNSLIASKMKVKEDLEKLRDQLQNDIRAIPIDINILRPPNGKIQTAKIELANATRLKIKKATESGIKTTMAEAAEAAAAAGAVPPMVPIPATPVDNLAEREKQFRYKIMMGELFDDDQIKDELILRNKSLYKNKIFNSKEFNSITDKNAGVIGPDEEIKKLIDNIGKNSNTIENIIKNHPDFLHNRVGTPLNENEKKNIMKNKKDFDKGDLVSFNDGLNEKIAIYMETITSGPDKDKMKIVKINRNNKKNITVDIEIVDSASLSYINEEIKQVFKANLKLAVDDLIETYTIDF